MWARSSLYKKKMKWRGWRWRRKLLWWARPYCCCCCVVLMMYDDAYFLFLSSSCHFFSILLFIYVFFFLLSFTSAFKSLLVERLPPTSNFPYSIVFFLKYVSQQNILTSCAFINSIKTWKCLFTNLKQLFSWFLYLQKCIFVVA